MKNIVTAFFLMVLMGCSNQPLDREIISSQKAPAAIGPYSQAIRVGDRLYLSGQLGLDPVTGKFADSGIAALQDYIKQENETPNPSKSAAYWRLGLIYEQQEEWEKAGDSYRQGLKLDPDDQYCQKALDKLSNK